jgi:hypothetical protein
MVEEKVQAVKTDIQRLLDAGFIRESDLSRVAVQCCNSLEEKREMEDVYRLHGPQQILPKG